MQKRFDLKSRLKEAIEKVTPHAASASAHAAGANPQPVDYYAAGKLNGQLETLREVLYLVEAEQGKTIDVVRTNLVDASGRFSIGRLKPEPEGDQGA